MKKTGLCYLWMSIVAVVMLGEISAKAQIKYSIDTDIYTLRNDLMPDFRYHYDDYLQYSPAVVMAGLKACGYESRSSWGRMLVSDAFSIAITTGAVNGIKYSVKRMRPDGSRRNSFPSGHTATSFMTAAMLHYEYGWQSPWFSIGGYTVAAVSGLSRILNNRHWLTDVIAGAAVGIGSVHLGYYLADLIFKDKHISSGYIEPEFIYDATEKHYVSELLFGRRLILGSKTEAVPMRGSMAGVSTDIPIIPGIGITARATANSYTYRAEGLTSAGYGILAGGYYNYHFAKRLELQAKGMAGYAWQASKADAGATAIEGLDICAGIGLSLMLESNFKIKVFSEYETISRNNSAWLQSILVGFGTSWFL